MPHTLDSEYAVQVFYLDADGELVNHWIKFINAVDEHMALFVGGMKWELAKEHVIGVLNVKKLVSINVMIQLDGEWHDAEDN